MPLKLTCHSPCCYLRILILLVIWSFFNACSPASREKGTGQDQQQTAFTFYYQAGRQIEDGRLKEALANLDSAIIRRPNYANFYQVKGWVLEQLDSLDNAVSAYEKCLEVNDNSPEVQLRLGRLYLKQENFDRAAFFLRKSSHALPDSHVILLDLSEAYLRLERSALALDQLKLYDKKSVSQVAFYHKLLGMGLYNESRYVEAQQALQAFVNKVKDDPEAWKYLGLARFAQKDFDQSISDLNRAGNLDPSDGDIYLYRSRYFVERGKPEVAKEQLLVGVGRDPDNTALLFELGRLSFDHNNYAESKKYLKEAVKVDPEHWVSYKYLGLVAEYEGNISEARDYFNRYLDNIYEEDRDIRDRLKKIVSSPQQQ